MGASVQMATSALTNTSPERKVINHSRTQPVENSVKRKDYEGSSADGEKSQAVQLVGPFHAMKAKSAADAALKSARDSGLPGLHNGRADAYRHCLWSCEMSRSIGVEKAQLVGDNHEAWGNNPAGETQMDLFNNRAGREFSSSPTPCSSSCMQGVEEGSLILSPNREEKP
jgi:hypothetical protein